MKRIIPLLLALIAAWPIHAKNITITVSKTKYQTITGFGAAACDGAMCPFGSDTKPVQLLYGKQSKIGLNIMRMEISPSFSGESSSNYSWNGSLPSAKLVKQRGGIVFGTPWSPPGSYKTNGAANGGKAESQGQVKATLRDDCYEKFFPWLNTFLKWMKSKGVKVDAVSIQNEPDWWVDYSGCLYTPQQQLNLVKNYAHLLDRETYPWVRLISAEPLGFDPNYSNTLLNNSTARSQVDIIAGHLYGQAPLGNMKNANNLASKYKKELWMTEHIMTKDIEGRLPNWSEQLEFAQELNESMQAGCTGYIYWYMRAHWSFVGTGETRWGAENKRNVLLPRAYVMSHFSKHVTGSTRLNATATNVAIATGAPFQTTAYIKGDSIIVMTINKSNTEYKVRVRLPYLVQSGTYLVSTGNEKENLCQTSEIEITEPTKTVDIPIPVQSLNTFIFMLADEETAIDEVDDEEIAMKGKTEQYDLQGRHTNLPNDGLYILRREDGTTRKLYKK